MGGVDLAVTTRAIAVGEDWRRDSAGNGVNWVALVTRPDGESGPEVTLK